jgi:photosystem II stability/assembly factor-like uncharacterized protein
MASGPGEKSRLYKTSDGCKTWKLILRNRDNDGFWDTLRFDGGFGWLLGDPVHDSFQLYETPNKGRNWYRQVNTGLGVMQGTAGAFAASNSALAVGYGPVAFGIGGKGGAFVIIGSEGVVCVERCSDAELDREGRRSKWRRYSVSIGTNSESSGVFAIAFRIGPPPDQVTGTVPPGPRRVLVAVGGDYSKPDQPANTATCSLRSDERYWTASTTPPHGYRSSVQWSETLKAWITAGTNGSDISRDDGKTWQPLDDGNWNALSLPFVVGPNGRIARLNPEALPPSR